MNKHDDNKFDVGGREGPEPDAEADFQRTRRKMQYLGLAADIVIRMGGEIVRTILR